MIDVFRFDSARRSCQAPTLPVLRWRVTRRVQKYKCVAKPLMVALSMRMIDELGDGPGRGS